jgi:hypothetical protein
MQHDSISCVNSVFEQPWWLDAVAPGQWSCATVESGGEVVARLPYVYQKRLGFNLLGMPEYTQTLGIWIKDTGAKTTKRLERQKDLLFEIIEQLPKRYNVDIYLDHRCRYVLPFKWKGFALIPVFSYRLESLADEDVLWNGLRENAKTDIKKAQNRIKIVDSLPVDTLISIQAKTFARQGRRNYDSHSALLKRLDKTLSEHNARKLLCALDERGRVHAASYFVYDEQTCYYLIGGGDPELRNSGAASLLLWEGIKFASSVSKAFDFEGSMIEDIERFFRSFGGEPVPYYRVTRLNTALSFADYMKPKAKRMLNWK